MDITTHRHRALHRLYVPLLYQNRSRLIAKRFHLHLRQQLCTSSDARSNGPDPHTTASFSVSLSLSTLRSAPPRSPISRIESCTKNQTANRPISVKSHRNQSTKCFETNLIIRKIFFFFFFFLPSPTPKCHDLRLPRSSPLDSSTLLHPKCSAVNRCDPSLPPPAAASQSKESKGRRWFKVILFFLIISIIL